MKIENFLITNILLIKTTKRNCKINGKAKFIIAGISWKFSNNWEKATYI